MDQILDKFFFIFHSSLMVFILIGWVWKKTRLANLIVVLMTAFSWFFLGLWYGFGYCPSTDWHWQVRMRLGRHDLPDSYTKFLVESFTGWEVSQKTVDVFTVLFLMLALFASAYTNLRSWKKRSKG